MLVLVSIDSDYHLSCAMSLVICDAYHLCLPDNGASASVSGHNCEEAQSQAPIKSLLASAVGYMRPSWDRVDRSISRHLSQLQRESNPIPDDLSISSQLHPFNSLVGRPG